MADWLEATMIVANESELSRDQVSDLLQRGIAEEADYYETFGEGADVDDPDVDELMDEDPRVDGLLETVQERSERWNRVYPFRVDSNLVQRQLTPGLAAYVVLLWPTVPGTPMRREEDWDRLEDAFDAVCALALRRFLGDGARVVRFAQRYASDSDAAARPIAFDEAIRWLKDLLKCRPKDPVVMPPADEPVYPARTYKDGGVDIVAWREFKDGLPGFPVVLAQSTIQTSWRSKVSDVNAELWNGWLNFHTPPQRVLCIPGFAKSNLWFDRTKMAGLILDRPRLCELLNGAEEEELGGVVDAGGLEVLNQEIDAFEPL